MNVTRNTLGDVAVTMQADEANTLATVLGLVADRTQRQSMDRLYTLLTDNGVIDAGTAYCEKNEDEDSITVFGAPSVFVVVE